MKLNKQIIGYLVLSVVLFLFNYLYSLFSHGVTSNAMSTAWLYSLVGSIFYLIVTNISKAKKSVINLRLSTNIINAGMASLIVGQLLKGVVEIAGTNSDYLSYYMWAGSFLVSCGVLICLRNMTKSARAS